MTVVRLFSSRVMKQICQITSARETHQLLDSIDHILTDCDGVLYRSKGPIDGAPEAVAKLRSMGKKIIYVTNNSTISRVKATQKLNEQGFPADREQVFPTSFAVANYFKRHAFHGKVFVLGCQGIRDELQAASISYSGDEIDKYTGEILIPDVTIDPEVDAVVIAYDNMISLPKLIKTCTYASKVAPEFFVAAEPDESIVRLNGQILPLAGCAIAFVEAAVHRRPVVLGKPMSHLFRSVCEAHPDLDPSRTLMIGDRLNTDIAFGNNNGVKFTLLVESGENKLTDALQAQAAGHENQVPSHWAPSLGFLNQFL